MTKTQKFASVPIYFDQDCSCIEQHDSHDCFIQLTGLLLYGKVFVVFCRIFLNLNRRDYWSQMKLMLEFITESMINTRKATVEMIMVGNGNFREYYGHFNDCVSKEVVCFLYANIKVYNDFYI